MLIVLVVLLVELNSSVAVVAGVCPPKANPAVEVPAPPKAYLDEDKSAFSDQEIPFQSSVLPTVAGVGVVPPKAKAAVLSAPAPPT